MTERTQLILFFSIATFFVVLFIAVLLLMRRRDRAQPGSLEAYRSQSDAEHGAQLSLLRELKGDVKKILHRFGFLDRGDDP